MSWCGTRCAKGCLRPNKVDDGSRGGAASGGSCCALGNRFRGEHAFARGTASRGESLSRGEPLRGGSRLAGEPLREGEPLRGGNRFAGEPLANGNRSAGVSSSVVRASNSRASATQGREIPVGQRQV